MNDVIIAKGEIQRYVWWSFGNYDMNCLLPE